MCRKICRSQPACRIPSIIELWLSASERMRQFGSNCAMVEIAARLEIQPEVTLGSRLAPTVLGPVHAGGHQLDGGGVDDVDDAVESTQDAPS